MKGPNTVEVGGIHCRPARPVEGDDELRDWMDSAKDGFIFLSFGTVSHLNQKLSCHTIYFSHKKYSETLSR